MNLIFEVGDKVNFPDGDGMLDLSGEIVAIYNEDVCIKHVDGLIIHWVRHIEHIDREIKLEPYSEILKEDKQPYVEFSDEELK